MYSLELFLEKISDSFESILNKNILNDINISKNNTNSYTFNFLDKNTALVKISDIITEFIISNYESTIIRKLVFSDYTYFSNSEKEIIINKAADLLNSENNDLVKILVSLKRRFLIKQCILKFLSENSYLHLAGFIQFRLTEYKKLLSEIIEKVINDFKIQNEYNEFIAMLKFFVDTQKNKAPRLHIIFEKNGEYTILNEYNKNITTDCFKDFLNDTENHNLNNEDLLISSLITLAPKKIIIHLTSENYNKKILSTIEQIFTNKVVINETLPTLQLVNTINWKLFREGKKQKHG